ncbi:sensor histidine kinase [Arcobacter sp. YIC-464]|uniref:sensor histidine kinase n=1 Tax=Arcobacter sp. YIC-464 TaxID=3376631 RepID=UPI003C209B92
MKNNNEKIILNFIKFTPPFFIILISIVLSIILYLDKKKTIIEQKKTIKEELIFEQKQIIKNEVDRTYRYIKYLEETTENQLKEHIKNKIHETHNLITELYEKYKNIKTKDEVFEIINTTLSKMRYDNGKGYYFTYNRALDVLLYPISNDRRHYKKYDKFGNSVVEEIEKTFKDKKERFGTYFWYKPNQGEEQYKKIAYYKYFEPFDMVLGTGIYLDDFEKKIQKKVLDYTKLVSYDDSSYLFVIDYNTVYLSHKHESYIGKTAKENNDTQYVEDVIAKLIEIAKNGSGFYEYIQNKKPGTNIPMKKISYIRGNNNWGWLIGMGIYHDDILKKIEDKEKIIDEKFNQYIQNIIIGSLILTILMLLVSIYISNVLRQKFNLYREDIEKKQSILFQQSKMAAMGEMIGNIAHQWRQPLSTITTVSSGMSLQKQMGVLSDEFFEEGTQKITKSAQYLSQTIDDFRNFFSPTKDKNNFILENAFESTFDLVDAQFNSKNIKIIKNIEKITLFTYESELIQVFINILNNAKDAFLENKSNNDRLIFINAHSSESLLTIEIKDSAGGIPDSVIQRVFEPYFTTKGDKDGTGIGLYMTKEIITKHLNGKITVENCEYKYDEKVCKGAIFKIVLPL